MSYNTFKSEWLGRRVDYDKVYSFQCVDLILQYVKQEGGLASGVWGNAIDYWQRPTAPLLSRYDRLSTTDPQQGDIVVLYGLPGNPYGHIGICESNGATTVKLLEQNGAGSATGTGRDAIGVYRDIPKSRIAGCLRLKAPVVVPPPPAARGTVFLPSTDRTWTLYYVGTYLRPGTSDVKAVLSPASFPPGLTYKVVSMVGDYACVIDTQMFGRGVIWTRGTSAKYS